MSSPTVSLQCAFASNPGATSPSWQDITDSLVAFDVKRGRQYELDEIQPGTMTVTLDDAARRFDPTYTGSPFYPYVLPRRRIRLSAVWSGTTYYLFDGYVERWEPTYEGPDWTQVTVVASDQLMPLSKAPITGTFASKASGSRISDVLAAALWPTSAAFTGWTLGTSGLGNTTKLGVAVPLTVIDAGESTVQAVTYVDSDKRMALDEIRVVEDTEAGVFFADGQGRLIFHDRNHRLQKLTAAATFTDDVSAAGGTVVAYRDIVPSFDYDHGANQVEVTRSGGTTQTQTSTAAIDAYFRSVLQLSTLHTSDTDANNLALFLLRQRKDVRDASGNPRYRFDRIVVDPWAQDSWANVLSREISDRVTVQRAPSSHPVGVAQTISLDCFIEGIEHQCDAPNEWTTTFELSPCSPANDIWTLGNSQLGSPVGTALAY